MNAEVLTETELEEALNLLTKINPKDAGLSDWQKQFAADQVERARRWGPDLRISPKQLAQVRKIAAAQGVEITT